MKPFEEIVVEITLSRPYYRLGGTVVGTLLVVAAAPSSALLLRDAIASLKLTVTGYCRLDPRWHGKEEVTALLQRFHSTTTSTQPPFTDRPEPSYPPLPHHTAPIWSSGIMELMDLPERTIGRWSDAQPHPIVLPRGYRRDDVSTTTPLDVAHYHRPTAGNEPQQQQQQLKLEEQQLAFTFRVTLPKHTPHTLVATSCRYYYTVAVQLQKTRRNNSKVVEWTEVPITVYTALPDDNNNTNNEMDDESDSFLNHFKPWHTRRDCQRT